MYFFIPYTYGLASRAATFADKLSFAAIFALPTLIACMITRAELVWLLPRFLLAFTALYCVYEAGYIQNDVYATKREAAPNYRLVGETKASAERLAPLLIPSRLLVSLCCSVALIKLGGVNAALFLLLLTALGLAFALHNIVRSRLNILTYALLVTLKYMTVPLLFVPSYMFAETICALVFAFPLLRAFEHAAKPKYGIKKLSGIDFDELRVRYYGAFSVMFLLMSRSDERFLLSSALALWFFAYRTAVFYILSIPSLRRKYRS